MSHFGIASQLAENSKSVHPGHHDIKKQKIGFLFQNVVNGALTHRIGNLITICFQSNTDRLHNIHFVIRDHNVFAHHRDLVFPYELSV